MRSVILCNRRIMRVCIHDTLWQILTTVDILLTMVSVWRSVAMVPGVHRLTFLSGIATEIVHCCRSSVHSSCMNRLIPEVLRDPWPSLKTCHETSKKNFSDLHGNAAAHLWQFYFFLNAPGINELTFLPARRYASAGYSDLNVSVCHAPVLSKRRKLAAWFLHRLVAPRL